MLNLRFPRTSAILFAALFATLGTLPVTRLNAAEFVAGHVRVSGSQDEATLRNIAHEVEDLGKAHAAFLADLGLGNAAPQPLQISVLTSRNEYDAFKAQSRTKSESPRGYYEHEQRHIVTWENAHAGFSTELRRILSHETFHHQIHTTLGDNIPLWLDEGLAVLFEDAAYVEGMRLDRAAMHRSARSQVKAAMQNQDMMSLVNLLSLDRQGFYRNDIQKNYSQAWSFVYFLINDPLQKNNRTLEAVMGAIRLGDSPVKALVVGSGGNLEQLQSKWYEYVSRI